MAVSSSDENYTALSPRTLYINYTAAINNKNLDTYRKFSFLVDKVLKLKVSNEFEFESDLKPLLETESSLSSFTSFADKRVIGTSYSEDSLSHIESEPFNNTCRQHNNASRIFQDDTDPMNKENMRTKYKVQNLRYNSNRHNFSDLRKDTLKRLPRANKFSSNYPVKPFADTQKQSYTAGGDNNEHLNRRTYEHYNEQLELPHLRRWNKTNSHIPKELFTYIHHRKCNKLDESFSYEQKRLLKKKMRDVKKRPETYVIIGMI